ncbi:MAG TPA: hypothetical protein ENJ76_03550 [Oceanithermus sp.]|nr:hypothetical protein [Oceanithermus sp.]
MRTTLDLPDELYRELKRRAAEEGLPLKELVAGLLRQALSASGAPRRGRPDRPPVAPLEGRAPLMEKEELEEVAHGELERHARSLGH